MIDKKMEWFVDSRFGMFIHWGLYAIPARGEWVRSQEQITVEDYQKYFDAFDPVDYNPSEWARLAKDAGMKYAVLTAKHHDGFCLYDSKYTDYKATNTKAGRDLVREYIEAFRAEGLKVGLYYSIIDWHHPDYPHYGDFFHPMRNNEAFKDTKHDFGNYLEYMHGQVEELCTNYGKIDLLWFDFSYGDLHGEAWKATELVRMIRRHQPEVIIDNRLDNPDDKSLLSGEPNEYSGDFVSPEQLLPPKGVFDKNGNSVPWELCATINGNWGHHETDRFYKPSSMLIRKLVECVSKGGNMLLNVGPDAKGNIPAQSVKILRGIAEWMKLNGESVYGCGNVDMEKPDYGRVTGKDGVLYFHVMENTIGALPLLGLSKDRIKSMSYLYSGAEINYRHDFSTEGYKNIVFADLGLDPILPDTTDTVIKIELADVKRGVEP